MKNLVILIAVIFAALPAKADKGEFPLVLHVTAVEMHQSGGNYPWQLYTSKIDGDANIYGLRTVSWSSPRNVYLRLSINDYRARWTKRGKLEVQVANEKGKMVVLTEEVMSER